jgi:hypothetical protein
MTRRKSDPTFWYERGNLKFRGQTAEDRRSMRIDNVLYWTYRILMALAVLIFAVTRLIKSL